MRFSAIALAVAGWAASAYATIAPVYDSKEAIEAGKSGAIHSEENQNLYFHRWIRNKGKGEEARAFEVRIVTPFSKIANAALMEKYPVAHVTSEQLVPDAPADEQLVELEVVPSFELGTPEPVLGVIAKDASAVSDVFIRRGKTIVRSTSTKALRAVFAKRDENDEIVGEFYRDGGTYFFPISAFDPKLGPLEIVIVPDTKITNDEAVQKLSAEDLRTLR